MRRLSRDAWRELRRQIHDRDGGRCQRCNTAVRLVACHIDHILPLCQGGTYDPANLRVLCVPCHVLRAGAAHDRLRVWAAEQGLLPRDWHTRLWSDVPEATAGGGASAGAPRPGAAPRDGCNRS